MEHVREREREREHGQIMAAHLPVVRPFDSARDGWVVCLLVRCSPNEARWRANSFLNRATKASKDAHDVFSSEQTKGEKGGGRERRIEARKRSGERTSCVHCTDPGGVEVF